MPAKRGRRGRKALRPLHRGRDNRLHALPSVGRQREGRSDDKELSVTSWALALPRQLRATRCPLSRYIESTMLHPPADLRARSGDPLPCPPKTWRLPPYPRSSRCRATWARRGAAHIWTNCIVAALSHLAMGRQAIAPPHARAGAPLLHRKQYGLTSTIGYGRTFEKLERLMAERNA